MLTDIHGKKNLCRARDVENILALRDATQYSWRKGNIFSNYAHRCYCAPSADVYLDTKVYTKNERSIRWATASHQGTMASVIRCSAVVVNSFTAINKRLEALPATMSGRSVATTLRIWTLLFHPATFLLSGHLLSLWALCDICFFHDPDRVHPMESNECRPEGNLRLCSEPIRYISMFFNWISTMEERRV